MEIRKEESKPYVICGKTDIKSLLGNAGNNEETNCKSNYIQSFRIMIPLASKRQIVKIFFNI
jgi:hypothetical protein